MAVERVEIDSGLLSLLTIAGFHGIAVDEAKLNHEFGQDEESTFSTQTILLAGKSIGLSAKLVRQNPSRLDRAPLPAMAIDTDGRYFIAGKYDAGSGSPGNGDSTSGTQDSQEKTTARI